MCNLTIDKVSREMGLASSFIEHGIYVVGEGDATVFLALYVNEWLIVWKSEEPVAEVKKEAERALEGLREYPVLLARRDSGGIREGPTSCYKNIVSARFNSSKPLGCGLGNNYVDRLLGV